MIILIKEKPLSVNDAWQGRRFKTPEYKTYEKLLLLNLPKHKMVKGKVAITYRFHLKNHSRTDSDNLLKCLNDILVKKGYIEDDRKIYESHVFKIPAKDDSMEINIQPIDI